MQSSITRLAGSGARRRAGHHLGRSLRRPLGRLEQLGGSAAGGRASGKKIALLLPESKTTRYESRDRPLFKAAVKAQCPDCKVIYSNADQDAAKQQQQAESALTQGAKVLVLDPVDSKAAASIANSAKGSKVPVIAYDRFIAGAPVDYYVSFDNEKVGTAAGPDARRPDEEGRQELGQDRDDQRLADRPQRRRSSRRARTASSTGAARSSPAEYDTPDWSPDKAQQWMESQLTNVKSGSPASTPPTTARRRRHRRAEGRRRQPAAAGHRPGRRARRASSGSSPGTRR